MFLSFLKLTATEIFLRYYHFIDSNRFFVFDYCHFFCCMISKKITCPSSTKILKLIFLFLSSILTITSFFVFSLNLLQINTIYSSLQESRKKINLIQKSHIVSLASKLWNQRNKFFPTLQQNFLHMTFWDSKIASLAIFAPLKKYRDMCNMIHVRKHSLQKIKDKKDQLKKGKFLWLLKVWRGT